MDRSEVNIMSKETKLLRKQLELLAEQSNGAADSELARLSTAMCEVYRELERNSRNWRLLVGIALLFAISLYLLICILIHI